MVDQGSCGYVCFYNGKRVEVYADTTFQAQKQVAAMLKVPPKKQYMITVVLAERNGDPVKTDPASL